MQLRLKPHAEKEFGSRSSPERGDDGIKARTLARCGYNSIPYSRKMRFRFRFIRYRLGSKMRRTLFTVLLLCFATCSIACSFKMPAPPSAADPSAHNRLFNEGCDLISPYLVLQKKGTKDPRSGGAKREILAGIEKLEQVLILNPKNASAYWFIGKGHQVLKDQQQAYSAFKSSWSIQKQNANVAQDYMVACLNLGHSAEGVQIADEALKLKPDDPAVIANHALALLIDGQLDRAEDEVRKSLQIAPVDHVTLELQAAIEDVKSGKRSRPTRLGDLISR
jgi:tetratricopeptide (TPR) repeat protein